MLLETKHSTSAGFKVCKLQICSTAPKDVQELLGHADVSTTVDIRNPNTIQPRKQPTVQKRMPGIACRFI